MEFIQVQPSIDGKYKMQGIKSVWGISIASQRIDSFKITKTRNLESTSQFCPEVPIAFPRPSLKITPNAIKSKVERR